MARPHVLRQIRRFCLDCQGNASASVRACEDDACALWSLRCEEVMQITQTTTPVSAQAVPQTTDTPATKATTEEHNRKALRCVRRHCLDCAGNRMDVRICTAKEECPLWSLRFGVYPATYKRVRERFARGKQRSLFD